MSRVICFRLDGNNPREAQALAALTARQEAGFSVRQVMVEALLGLDSGGNGDIQSAVRDLQVTLGDVQVLLERMQNGQCVSVPGESGEREQRRLSEGFLESVRKAARPGMKMRRDGSQVRS